MASMIAFEIASDSCVSFEINPGTLLQLLATMPDGGPRLKCYDGSVTLVSPGKSHETAGARFASLILAICLELRIKHTSLSSTTWRLAAGAGDTAYEADLAYYVQSYGTPDDSQPPTLLWKSSSPTPSERHSLLQPS